MRRGLCLAAVVLGLVARVALTAAYDHPRGDVALDIGVARSLAAGSGFRSGFERGTALVRGEGEVPPQAFADQHAPLWPLLAAPLAAAGLDPFVALRLLSLLCGVVLLAQVWRLTDRLTEGCVGAPDGLPALAAALVALGFVMVDASANGSLYAAQAVGVLLLVECLAAPRPSAPLTGLVLGLLLLLNHQCLVLVPLLPLVWWLGVPPCQRRRGLARGLAALAVAALCQVPWWWRNALVFGDPLHSVNGLYLLARLGVEPHLALEDGLPVARLVGWPSPGLLLTALRSGLATSLLYLFVALSLAVPMLLGVVFATAAPDTLSAVRTCDRRRLAAWAALAVLAAVAVAWPATKLRYLVSLVPLATALGVAALGNGGLADRGADGGGTGWRRAGMVALVAMWLALTLGTLDDLLGTADLPRPGRWWWLALGGLLTVVLPAWVHHTRRAPPARLPLVWGGLPLAAVLLALTVSRTPPTAYHGTPFLRDFFGQDAEAQEAELGAALARLVEGDGDGEPGPLRETARGTGAEDGHGAGPGGGADAHARVELVVGPVALLAWEAPGLVSLPLGAGSAAGAEALGALLASARPDGRRVSHVVTLAGDGWLPDDARPGQTWLDGCLTLLQVVDPRPERPGAVQLSRVVR